MKIFFAFLITIILAIVGYHLTFRRLKLPILNRRFYLTGIEFLFLGVLLGPHFLNIIDTRTAIELAPLTILLLGWIGLLFGVQFEMVKLKRIPGIFFVSAFAESILTALAVFAGMLYAIPYFVDIPEELQNSAILVMAATAAATAQTGLSLRKPGTYANNRKTVTLLRYISSINGLTAIFLLGLAFFFRNTLSDFQPSLPERISEFLIPILTFIGFLFLYLLFLIQRKQESELSLVVIGMTIFTSGAAMILNFSPLFANFLLGVCLVNLTRDKERIFELLASVEKPIYLLLLVFLGCELRFPETGMFIAAFLYFICRTIGKLTGGFTVTLLQKEKHTFSPFLGFGLLEQGALPLAILYDFHKGFSGEAISLLVSIIILSILINDYLSPFFLNRLLKRVK